MRIPRRRAGQSGSLFAARLLTVLAILLIAVVLIDMRIRPVVEEVVSHHSQAAAFRVMNSAMLDELEKIGITYDNIARVTRAADGTVASIQTDVVAVNGIKSRLSDSVTHAMEDTLNQRVLIPAGTLLGGNLTSGRGPEVEIRLLPMGYARSELYNEFISAGINQTLHRIMLETSVHTAAILPGYTVRVETATTFCIAETVIVGAIPEGYTIVGQDDRSELSKINDYKAE